MRNSVVYDTSICGCGLDASYLDLSMRSGQSSRLWRVKESWTPIRRVLVELSLLAESLLALLFVDVPLHCAQIWKKKNSVVGEC